MSKANKSNSVSYECLIQQLKDRSSNLVKVLKSNKNRYVNKTTVLNSLDSIVKKIKEKPKDTTFWSVSKEAVRTNKPIRSKLWIAGHRMNGWAIVYCRKCKVWKYKFGKVIYGEAQMPCWKELNGEWEIVPG